MYLGVTFRCAFKSLNRLILIACFLRDVVHVELKYIQYISISHLREFLQVEGNYTRPRKSWMSYLLERVRA